MKSRANSKDTQFPREAQHSPLINQSTVGSTFLQKPGPIPATCSLPLRATTRLTIPRVRVDRKTCKREALETFIASCKYPGQTYMLSATSVFIACLQMDDGRTEKLLHLASDARPAPQRDACH